MRHIIYNRCSKTTYINLAVAILVLKVWRKIIKQVLGWKLNIWDVYVSQPRGHQHTFLSRTACFECLSDEINIHSPTLLSKAGPCDWLHSNSICIPVFTQQSVTVYLTTFHGSEASQESKPQVNLRLIYKVLRTLRLPPVHLSPSGLCNL